MPRCPRSTFTKSSEGEVRLSYAPLDYINDTGHPVYSEKRVTRLFKVVEGHVHEFSEYFSKDGQTAWHPVYAGLQSSGATLACATPEDLTNTLRREFKVARDIEARDVR